jgi:hypothetical protein
MEKSIKRKGVGSVVKVIKAGSRGVYRSISMASLTMRSMYPV